jgi:sarcosine oxidase
MGLYQPHTGGHVSPRRQVQAQVTVAAQQGTQVIPAIVHSVQQVDGHVAVRTEAGETYRAAHVLVATGGFSNTKQLLPRRLETAVYARTIVLFELDNAAVTRLRGMPSIIHKPQDVSERCYILPPIQYPDGKYYLKIGGDTDDPTLQSLEALTAWFRSSGRAAAADALTHRLQSIVPDVRPLSIHTDTCVTTHTPTGNLYIDKLPGGRVGILTGGNGSAAKSADEIGRIGALMMLHNEWTYDLDARHFQARFVES